MKITVELFAQLRDAAGNARVQLECPDGTTVEELLKQLADGQDPELGALLFRGEALSPTILLAVDGQQVRWGEGRTLAPGERVVLASPIAGG